MDLRQQAIEIMDEMQNCRPRFFFEKISELEKGTHFVLAYLANHKNEVISLDLSKALCVSTARMAKLLSSMEKKGLIIKKSSISDARKTVVQLTEKGKKITSKYKEAIIILVSKMIQQVGYDDLKEFIRISYKMKNVSLFDDETIKVLKNL